MSGSRSPVQESPGDSPTTIDVSRLHRQPGSRLELSFEFPAPGDLGVAMARVPEESPIEMDVSVESVVEGIWVSGTADVDAWRSATVLTGGVVADGANRADVPYPADARGVLMRIRRTTTSTRGCADTIDMHGPLRDDVVLSPCPLMFSGLSGHLPHLQGTGQFDGAPHDHPVADLGGPLLTESPPPMPERRGQSAPSYRCRRHWLRSAHPS